MTISLRRRQYETLLPAAHIPSYTGVSVAHWRFAEKQENKKQRWRYCGVAIERRKTAMCWSTPRKISCGTIRWNVRSQRQRKRIIVNACRISGLWTCVEYVQMFCVSSPAALYCALIMHHNAESYIIRRQMKTKKRAIFIQRGSL